MRRLSIQGSREKLPVQYAREDARARGGERQGEFSVSSAARFDRQKWRACSHANMRHQCLPSELGKVDGNMESKMCFFMFCFDDFLSTSLSLR